MGYELRDDDFRQPFLLQLKFHENVSQLLHVVSETILQILLQYQHKQPDYNAVLIPLEKLLLDLGQRYVPHLSLYQSFSHILTLRHFLWRIPLG